MNEYIKSKEYKFWKNNFERVMSYAAYIEFTR